MNLAPISGQQPSRLDEFLNKAQDLIDRNKGGRFIHVNKSKTLGTSVFFLYNSTNDRTRADFLSAIGDKYGFAAKEHINEIIAQSTKPLSARKIVELAGEAKAFEENHAETLDKLRFNRAGGSASFRNEAAKLLDSTSAFFPVEQIDEIVDLSNNYGFDRYAGPATVALLKSITPSIRKDPLALVEELLRRQDQPVPDDLRTMSKQELSEKAGSLIVDIVFDNLKSANAVLGSPGSGPLADLAKQCNSASAGSFVVPALASTMVDGFSRHSGNAAGGFTTALKTVVDSMLEAARDVIESAKTGGRKFVPTLKDCINTLASSLNSSILSGKCQLLYMMAESGATEVLAAKMKAALKAVVDSHSENIDIMARAEADYNRNFVEPLFGEGVKHYDLANRCKDYSPELSFYQCKFDTDLVEGMAGADQLELIHTKGFDARLETEGVNRRMKENLDAIDAFTQENPISGGVDEKLVLALKRSIVFAPNLYKSGKVGVGLLKFCRLVVEKSPLEKFAKVKDFAQAISNLKGAANKTPDEKVDAFLAFHGALVRLKRDSAYDDNEFLPGLSREKTVTGLKEITADDDIQWTDTVMSALIDVDDDLRDVLQSLCKDPGCSGKIDEYLFDVSKYAKTLIEERSDADNRGNSANDITNIVYAAASQTLFSMIRNKFDV